MINLNKNMFYDEATIRNELKLNVSEKKFNWCITNAPDAIFEENKNNPQALVSIMEQHYNNFVETQVPSIAAKWMNKYHPVVIAATLATVGSMDCQLSVSEIDNLLLTNNAKILRNLHCDNEIDVSESTIVQLETNPDMQKEGYLVYGSIPVNRITGPGKYRLIDGKWWKL